VPEDAPADRQIYSRVTLGRLTAGQAYCLSFTYSMTGVNIKHIFVEEQPSTHVEQLEGEITEMQQVKLSLEGHDKLVSKMFSENNIIFV
jgi:hypothetical protein